MGKNVYTEIKCHSLLPLDDIVKMVVHRDTIPEVKDAYVNFLTHCYIDTEVEMKEIYTSNHMWDLFEKSFLLDMAVVSNATHDRLVLLIRITRFTNAGICISCTQEARGHCAGALCDPHPDGHHHHLLQVPVL